MTLGQLHHVLQAAMGWTDAHLHEFVIEGKRFSVPHDEDDDTEYPVTDERDVQLHTILKAGLEFQYQYDFGDSWFHRIRVEQAAPQDEIQGAAFIEAGEGACPPEDCGGVPEYQDFLDLLKTDPQDEEVVSFLEWAGEDFDPDLFDRHAANAALLRMAWNRWGTA